MADFVRYYVGDVVQMKKAHPYACHELGISIPQDVEVFTIGINILLTNLKICHKISFIRKQENQKKNEVVHCHQ